MVELGDYMEVVAEVVEEPGILLEILAMVGMVEEAGL
jgi:hypothetical protein